MSSNTVAEVDRDFVDAEAFEPEPTDAQRAAAGLRQLADLLDANPDLPGTRYAFGNINLFPRDRAGVLAWARAVMQSTGKVDKFQNGDWAGVTVEFGPVKVDVTIERDEVCERVVVGQKIEFVPDPEVLAEVLAEVPKVKKLVDIVEWRCGSLLAPAEVAGAILAPDAEPVPAGSAA